MQSDRGNIPLALTSERVLGNTSTMLVSRRGLVLGEGPTRLEHAVTGLALPLIPRSAVPKEKSIFGRVVLLQPPAVDQIEQLPQFIFGCRRLRKQTAGSVAAGVTVDSCLAETQN